MYCRTGRHTHNWAFNCLPQSIYASSEEKCGSRPLSGAENRSIYGIYLHHTACGNGSNAAYITARKSIVGNWKPGITFACMVPKERCTTKSATSNQSSLQDFHACTSHYQPCDTRHICLLICGRLLPCRVILCTSRTYITNVSRKISDRHQGSCTERVFTKCGIFPQAEPRSMAQWLNCKSLFIWPGG